MPTLPEHDQELGRAPGQHPPRVLIAGCQQGLQQCSDLLAALAAADYGFSTVGVASIGAHVRHISERYQCFLSGLPGGCVDYDARDRQRSLEADPAVAALAVTGIRRQLDALSAVDRPLRVRESVLVDTACGEVSSSLGRELLALVGHTTHHLAMIALLARARGYQLDGNFGKAAATIIHERQTAAN